MMAAEKRSVIKYEGFIVPPGQVAQLVERSPEKAGVGGSIPSLATTFSSTYRLFQFHSDSFQNFGLSGLASEMRLVLVHIHVFSVPLQFPGLF
jgi:hypothetical protein